MNAAVADIEESTLTRRIHGCERSWLEYSLRAWGDWIWQNRHFEGYPTSDNVQAFISGAGGGTKGHRVLCLDMPHKIYSMHARVLLLDEDLQAAVMAEYIVGVKEDGTLWTREEKCERLGLSERGFRDRLHRARLKILGV